MKFPNPNVNVINLRFFSRLRYSRLLGFDRYLEQQNNECSMSKYGIASRYLLNMMDKIPSFVIRNSLFYIRYSVFHKPNSLDLRAVD